MGSITQPIFLGYDIRSSLGVIPVGLLLVYDTLFTLVYFLLAMYHVLQAVDVEAGAEKDSVTAVER
jgi:hypothetical protein